MFLYQIPTYLKDESLGLKNPSSKISSSPISESPSRIVWFLVIVLLVEQDTILHSGSKIIKRVVAKVWFWLRFAIFEMILSSEICILLENKLMERTKVAGVDFFILHFILKE